MLLLFVETVGLIWWFVLVASFYINCSFRPRAPRGYKMSVSTPAIASASKPEGKKKKPEGKGGGIGYNLLKVLESAM